MRSLWDRDPTSGSDPLPEPDEIDDLVVGAGLTGLAVALLLARAGRGVCVVEARHVGAGASGNTTAKVSLLQGTKLSRMAARQAKDTVRAYVEANREGQSWLLRFCDDHDVAWQRRTAITYAADRDEVNAAKAEHLAARSAGLDVRWVDDLDAPFENFGGVVLDDQAQFDPVEVLQALLAQVRAHGGAVVEGRRVVGVSHFGRPRVGLDDGTTLRAEHVILATGSPILDRGLYFAKLEPVRSYALAYECDDPPEAMCLSAGSTGRSVRGVPGAPTRLLVGGAGHVVGRGGSETDHLDELRAWTERWYPGAVETHAWSAQDRRSPDQVPHVGALPRGGGRILMATGYDKWGMTNAVAAALHLSAHILGEPPAWARRQRHHWLSPPAVADAVGLNSTVAVRAVSDLVRGAARRAVPRPPEGRGSIGRDGGLVPRAISTTSGRTCEVSGLCTHLGGVLHWNDAEHTWDCPLHGSRFSPTGDVLEGPATTPLGRRSDPKGAA